MVYLLPNGKATQPPVHTLPIFGLGTSIHWNVNLTETFPSGILCSSVQSRLFPSIPPENGPNYWEWLAPVVAKTPQALGVQTGQEYAVWFTLKPEHLLSDYARGKDKYYVSLECIPMDELVENEQVSRAELKPLVLATSEQFIIPLTSYPSSTLHGPIESDLMDISQLWEESVPSEADCKRLTAKMSTNIIPLSVGGLVYDRDAFIEYAFHNCPIPTNGQAFSFKDPYSNPVDRVWVDTQIFYRLERFVGRQLTALIQERQCQRTKALSQVNLQTSKVYWHDLIPVIKDVRFGEIYERHLKSTIHTRALDLYDAVMLNMTENGLHAISLLSFLHLLLKAIIQVSVIRYPLAEVLYNEYREFAGQDLADALLSPVVSRAELQQEGSFAIARKISAFILMTAVQCVMCMICMSTFPSKVRTDQNARRGPMSRRTMKIAESIVEFAKQVRALPEPKPSMGRHSSS